MSNSASILKQQGAALVVQDRHVPKPGPLDVLVKTYAVASNPVDWKMRDHGTFVESYPTVLGSDTAGTIEAVGSDIKKFKKGDRVTAFADALGSKNPDNGAFQNYVLAKDSAVAKLPDSISFEEGSILPMAVATAAVGIFLYIDIPRPPTKQQGAFIVWGASSSVGTTAVQIARSLGYTVFAICSPRHRDYVKKLGAHEVFNYNDSTVVQNIAHSIKALGFKSAIAYDAISENGSAPQTAAVLQAVGGGKLCLTLPWPEDAKKPEGVEIVNTFAMRVTLDAKDFGRWLFNDWLPKSLEDKTFVPSPAIEKSGWRTRSCAENVGYA